MSWIFRQQSFNELQAEWGGRLDQFRVVIARESGPALGHRIPYAVQGETPHRTTRVGNENPEQEAQRRRAAQDRPRGLNAFHQEAIMRLDHLEIIAFATGDTATGSARVNNSRFGYNPTFVSRLTQQ
jgi:hypothetical protein